MNFLEVKFGDAIVLNDSGQSDIGVFEPSTGEVFNFGRAEWPYQGVTKSRSDLSSEIGCVGIDSHYVFFWIQSKPSQ